MMRGRLGFAAAMAAMATGMGSGVDVLKSMFAPRFDIPHGGNEPPKPGKHRLSGTCGSPRLKSCTDWSGAPGQRQAARDAKRRGRSNYHFEQRIRWLERNQHVIAKRELDQARAAGPLGGRNAIIWGRR